MITIDVQQSVSPRRDRRGRPVAFAGRPRVVRMACASALAVLAWGGSGVIVSAAPPAVLQAPLQAAAITGLQQGARGTEVRALQQALIAAGVSVRGGADGVFGPATREALVSFQQARGLSTSGEVDAATADALAAATASGGSSSTPASANGYVGLAQGAKGQAVTDVQKRMIELGVYVPGGADGVYGPATTTAVTQFQRWNGLEATGTVTEATVTRLGITSGGSTAAPSTSNPAPTTPAPEPSPSSYAGLKVGSSGQAVKDLQTALIANGAAVRGGADGRFGPMTQSALKAFQRSKGLPETGVVADADAAALGLGAAAPTPAPSTPAPTPSNPYVGLTVGARGELVKNVQQALINAGISVRGGADGVFGNATKGAVVLFQQQKGLSVTGSVDQPSADALGVGAGAPVGVTNPTPTPAPDANPSGNPYVGLKVGAQGPLVKELQVALQSTGLVVRGGADGVFGNATKSSLIAFQSVNGIPQTGVVTEKGASILRLGSAPDTAAPQGAGNPAASVTLDRFPVQGQCFFGDTWHAARGGGRLHEGVDIIAPEGNLLYAVTDGHIAKQYWDYPGALAGNGLRLARNDGTYFTYLHMSSFAPGIDVGTKVTAGDVIGFVGNTGSSATPHLHFEVHPGGGAAVNPYPYVKAIDGCSNTTPQYQQSFPSPDA